MRIFTLSEPYAAAFQKPGSAFAITFEAFRNYVCTDAQSRDMLNFKNRPKFIRFSDMGPRLPNFHVGAVKPPAKLLFYCGCGGLGDQIMAWPVAKHLAGMGYDVHILSDPGNHFCWWYFDWVKSISLVPLAYETVKLFDYHVFFESVCNDDAHADQDHPIDRMCRKIGLNPADVEKVVSPIFTNEEAKMAMALCQQPAAVYQPAASTPLRSFAPETSLFFLEKLAEASNLVWYVTIDDGTPKPYVDLAKELEKKVKNVKIVQLGLRSLWALVQQAELVVGPDSMLLHAAGACGTPAVSVCGPIGPDYRFKYYPKQTHLWKPEACPMAPCFCHGQTFPWFCPAKKNRNECEVISAVSLDDLIGAVKKIGS